MVTERYTNGPDSEQGTGNSDTLFGGGGNDLIFGLGGDEDVIRGEGGNDDLRGNGGVDIIFGGNDNDQIRGGDGKDKLYGGDDNDIIFGQKGFDTLAGGAGNDTLIGLGELKRDLNDVIITDQDPEGVDTFYGDGPNVPIANRGADTFNLRKNSDDEGRLFIKGQKFALIKDFRTTDGNNGDKIRLPGSADDYVAQITGPDNNDTAIFYVEEADIDIGFSVPGVSFGTGLAIDVPESSALVAIVEDAVIRNMLNTDVYEYTGR